MTTVRSMTMVEIRTELLEQHTKLRALIEETRKAASLWRQGRGARQTLQESLRELVDATHVHNDREEQLLAGIIPSVDAWGPVRAEIMDDEHVQEHRELTVSIA